MRLLDKETTTGGGAQALDGVDPLDVLGDGSNIPLRHNDVCFVINPAGSGGIYRAYYQEGFDATGLTGWVKPVSNGNGWGWKQLATSDMSLDIPDQHTIKIPDYEAVPGGYSFVRNAGYIESFREVTNAHEKGYMYWNDRIFDVGDDGEIREYTDSYPTTGVTLDTPVNPIKHPKYILVGDVIYMFGWDVDPTPTDSILFAYNLSTSTYDYTLTGHPGGIVRAHGLCTDGTDIYVLGGYDETLTALNIFYKYTISTDTWSSALAVLGFTGTDIACACDSSSNVWAMDDKGATPIVLQMYNGSTWSSAFTTPYTGFDCTGVYTYLIYHPNSDTLVYTHRALAIYDITGDSWVVPAGYGVPNANAEYSSALVNDRVVALDYYSDLEHIISPAMLKIYTNIP